MAVFGAFLKGVGKAIVGCAIPGVVAEVLCEVLPEAARKMAGWWVGEKKPAERRAEVEALAQADPAEVKKLVGDVVAEVAADKPPEFQRQLSVYLSLVPAAVRASLRRPADPSGKTVPPVALLETPEEILSLLPA
ncbi:MAG: hypothetical protein K2W96_14655, partial [Gemmataceae bacterium]|nr:hypothetical protein [Gemmataceae bacterium]